MRVHIVGVANSVGSLLAYHLRRVLPESEPIITIRRNTKFMRFFNDNDGSISLTRNGIRHTETGFLSEIPNASLSANLETASMGEEHIDCLIVVTRTYNTLPMLNMLKPRLSTASTIVLLQNGIGIYQDVLQFLYPVPETRPHFVLASNSHRAFNKATCDVVHTGTGEITFAVHPNVPFLVEAAESGFFDESVSPFERKGRLEDLHPNVGHHQTRFDSLQNTVRMLLGLEELNAKWVSMMDFETLLRQRAAIQSVVDPLTTIMNCRNGQILMGPDAGFLMDKICDEASGVFIAERAAGRSPIPLPRQLLAQELRNEVERYVESTHDDLSPMLTDMRLGKPTEIRHLNGYLVKLGLQYQARVTGNMMIMNLVNMRRTIPIDTTF